MTMFFAGPRVPVLFRAGTRIHRPILTRPSVVLTPPPALMVLPSWSGAPQYHAATILGGRMGQRLLPPVAPPPVPPDLPEEVRARQQIEDAIGGAEAAAEMAGAQAQRWCGEAEKSRRRADELEAAGDPAFAEENLKAQDAQNRCDSWTAELDAVLLRLANLMEYQARQLAPAEEEYEPPEEIPSMPEPEPPTGRRPIHPPRPVVPVLPPRPPSTLPVVPHAVTAPVETPTAEICPPGTVMTAQGCVPEGAAVATPTRFPGLQRFLPLVGGIPGAGPIPFAGA